MSLGSQDIAEARAEREERDRIELESRHDAEYELSLLGFYGDRVKYLFEVARAKGWASDMNNDFHVIISYVPGRYALTKRAFTPGQSH